MRPGNKLSMNRLRVFYESIFVITEELLRFFYVNIHLHAWENIGKWKCIYILCGCVASVLDGI